MQPAWDVHFSFPDSSSGWEGVSLNDPVVRPSLEYLQATPPPASTPASRTLLLTPTPSSQGLYGWQKLES